ncbi:TMEM165/GDT1 family protein [Caenispirillum bisanense]|uniref:GDT1 family protein n=1 Tax=Caenispirillum bisanense TaxID=414052 RepID=A0A286GHB6_9PROT|nr:TMEM165/GDT1 family protein [Caenispirillum bisanense]SOD94900.1 Putative Ca2+/H+ antiporter, TMEM165/GDT1 family [Caenispirillum bisanense]
MNGLLVSTGVVALAEIGDKTQLLALVLACRWGKPVPIILGIFLATVLNHAAAALVGVAVTDFLGPEILKWVLGLGFLAMAAWMLVPDKLDDDEGEPRAAKYGPFLATLVTFFLVEMGDKTQIATVALAAEFQNLWLVTLGTTLGMMIANVPVVIVGNKAAGRIPLALVRAVSAAIFAILGVMALLW